MPVVEGADRNSNPAAAQVFAAPCRASPVVLFRFSIFIFLFFFESFFIFLSLTSPHGDAVAGRPPPPQKHTHHDAGINTSLAGFRGSVETRSSGTVGATTNIFFYFFFFNLASHARSRSRDQQTRKYISLVALHLCSRICAHIVKSSHCLSLSIIRLSRIHINKHSHVTPMRQKKQKKLHTLTCHPIKFGVSLFMSVDGACHT